MKLKHTIASLILITAGMTASASAAVISWSYDYYGFILAPGNNGGQWVPNTTAGVVPADHWNDSWNENGTAWPSPAQTVNNLWDNAGNNSGVSLTYSGNDIWGIQATHTGQDADGTYNRELLNGYVDSNIDTNGSSTIAISSIPYSSYDIYVYFSSDTAGRSGTLNIGTTTFYFTTMGAAATSGANALFTQATSITSGSPTANADYAIFSGISGASQTITSSVHGGGGIAGFQIVQVVPEPGTFAMLFGGLGMLTLFRRRRA